jgi:hypothetical protein
MRAAGEHAMLRFWYPGAWRGYPERAAWMRLTEAGVWRWDQPSEPVVPRPYEVVEVVVHCGPPATEPTFPAR